MKLQRGPFWLVLFVLAQGCATLMQGTTQQIMVSSTPSGATVMVDRSMRFTTPAALDLSRKERCFFARRSLSGSARHRPREA